MSEDGAGNTQSTTSGAASSTVQQPPTHVDTQQAAEAAKPTPPIIFTIDRARKIVSPEDGRPKPDYPRFRVEPGKPVHLKDIDPGEHGQYKKKSDVSDELKRQRTRIESLQERLYAEHRQSLLVVLQAMDSGGKDGTIRLVFSGVNPQGCQVASFKVPTPEEADHDFLWRCHIKAPGRGMITIFNRSYYEDLLVVRVHELVPKEVWEKRYNLINDFERLLTLNGTIVLKFFLHISKDEQKGRFQSRLDHPDKNWKFSMADLPERARWDSYMQAYEDAIARCSTDYSPWYIVPANHKWFRNLVIARTIADTLEAMNPQYPPPPPGLDKVVIPD